MRRLYQFPPWVKYLDIEIGQKNQTLSYTIESDNSQLLQAQSKNINRRRWYKTGAAFWVTIVDAHQILVQDV